MTITIKDVRVTDIEVNSSMNEKGVCYIKAELLEEDVYDLLDQIDEGVILNYLENK